MFPQVTYISYRTLLVGRIVTSARDRCTTFVPKLGTWLIVPIIGAMIKSTRSEDGERLVAWLKEQRENRGLTMRHLAKELDAPHSFVGKVEQRERRLDVVEFVYYCEALGVSPVEGLQAVWPNLKP